MSPPSLWVTILAGGVGSRFWPLSRPSRPKQVLALASGRPLIEGALERARTLTSDDRIRVMTGPRMVGPVREALPDLDSGHFMVEPEARGTAPALTWAAHAIHGEDPDAVILSLHADHVLRPDGLVAATLRSAASLADETGLLFTVGALPDRAETGYGYIEPGADLETTSAPARSVSTFHEKPDAATAAAYVERGFLWNTGIFAWRASAFLDQVRTHAPEIAGHLAALDRGDQAAFFAGVPTTAVDVAVLERSSHLGVVTSSFEWDDVGSWEALARTLETDESGNVSVGEVHAVDASGNIAVGERRPVVLFGVDDLVVVDSDVLFVTHRSRAPELKRLLAELPPELRSLEP